MITSLVVVGVLSVVAYLERKTLKADAVKAEAKLVEQTQKFVASVRSVEGKVKDKIKGDVALIISDVKAFEQKEGASAKAVIEQVEARLKQIL